MKATTGNLSCEGCGREIPATAIWSACARKARLECSNCKRQVTHQSLLRLAEESEVAKAALVAFAHLIRYGWTSADAIKNAGVQCDTRLGGLLTGLQRAGYIAKAGGEPRRPVLGVLVDPKPVWVPGPMFPTVRPELVAAIRGVAPSVEFAH